MVKPAQTNCIVLVRDERIVAVKFKKWHRDFGRDGVDTLLEITYQVSGRQDLIGIARGLVYCGLTLYECIKDDPRELSRRTAELVLRYIEDMTKKMNGQWPGLRRIRYPASHMVVVQEMADRLRQDNQVVITDDDDAEKDRQANLKLCDRLDEVVIMNSTSIR